MKNMLLYNYNLNVDKLIKNDDGTYSFYINYDQYEVVTINRPEADIDEITTIVKNYPNQFHIIVYNRFNSPFFKFNDENYMLLKINGSANIEIDIMDIVKGEIEYSSKNNNLIRTDWSNLWSLKVDYLEYQVSELAVTHPIIKKSFSYYVGLAENAIEYFNMLNPVNLKTYLCHRRVYYPSVTKDFNNPLDLVIDYRVRNMASYLKNNFFNGRDVLPEVKILVKKNILNSLEYNLLFCRLLYPGYYFDKMQKIFEENEEEEILLKYIDKANEYEMFLNEVYKLFLKKSSMININWLIKKS